MGLGESCRELEIERPSHPQKDYTGMAALGCGLHSLLGGVGWVLLFKELRAKALLVRCSQTLLSSILQVRQGEQSSSVLFAA